MPKGILTLGVLVLSFGPTWGQCLPVESVACTIDLHGAKAPRRSPTCSKDAWSSHLTFTQPQGFTDSNADGWSEAVLALRFPQAAGCGCAVFRVHFGSESADHSVHFGNSATNDGFGGDAGVLPNLNYAEAHVSGDQWFVYSRGKPDRPQRDPLDPFSHHDTDLHLELPRLKSRLLEVEICDQSLSFAIREGEDAVMEGKMVTPLHSHSFVVDDTSTVYAAFNRVIHRTKGPPVKGRTGSGVERVEFFLTP